MHSQPFMFIMYFTCTLTGYSYRNCTNQENCSFCDGWSTSTCGVGKTTKLYSWCVL